MIERKGGTKRPMSSLRHSFLIAVVLLVCALVLVAPTAAADEWNGETATGFAAGSGTESDPYQIATGSQLAYLAAQVNGGETFAGKYFKLTNDISLAGYEWPGIGVYESGEFSIPAIAFSGIFDGSGCTLSDVTFSDNSNGNPTSEANNYRGFFNQLVGATVKNLKVSGEIFSTEPKSTEYGGALIAGHAYESTIDKCVAEGSIKGTHNVAGIVVRIRDAKIISCTNNAAVTGSHTKMGGIAALDQRSSTGSLIDGCTNNGKITSSAKGEDGVGGIIGWAGYPTAKITVKNCENKGTITAADTATVGQIAAESWRNYDVYEGNKGLSTMVATGHAAVSGLNFATVDDNSVATYIADKDLMAGETYLVTGPSHDPENIGEDESIVKPVITLESGEFITFDTSLASIDDSGIKAVDALEVTSETVDTKVTYTAQTAIATVDGKYYTTLQAAIDAAGSGQTVTLLGDITEAMVYVKDNMDVDINFAENTLYGSMFVNKTATADIYDGSIIQESTVAGIEVQGVVTLTSMNIESARHAIRVDGLSTDGTTLTVYSGTYKSNTPTGWTAHTINAGESSTVIIKDGTFIGAAEANAGGSGNCVMVKADTTVTIEGGIFYGANGVEGPICPASGLTISGGTFTDTTESWRYSANYFTDGKYWAFEAAETIETGKKTWEVKPAAQITWFNGDNYELLKEWVAVGDTPEYPADGTVPTKAADNQYTYTWNNGWTPEVTQVITPGEGQTYKPTFTETPKEYTVTFMSDGAEYDEITVAYGDQITLPATAPTKEGYTFDGWGTVPETMPANNLQLNAQWTIKQYTISFDTKGGTPIAEITADYGTPITKPADPAKAGATFEGWDTEIPEKMPAKDMIITALWNVDGAIETFSYSIPLSLTVLENTDVVIPIAFKNTVDDSYPAGWELEISVLNGVQEVSGLTYTLTGNSTYVDKVSLAGNIYGVAHKVATGQENKVIGTIDDLFTLTISGFETKNADYTVKVDIRSNVKTANGPSSDAKTKTDAFTIPLTVKEWVTDIEENIYNTTVDGTAVDNPWDFENRLKVNYTVINPKVAIYTSTLKDELVERNANADYHDLYLDKSEFGEIIKFYKFNEGQTPVETSAVTIAEENGVIVMKGADKVTDADYFIIAFTGNRVGDVANYIDRPNHVGFEDIDYILHEAVGFDYIHPYYEIYADTNKDGSIGASDAADIFDFISTDGEAINLIVQMVRP